MLAKGIEFGDTIGIVSPAGCDDTEIINKKISDFKNLGFKVKIGAHVFAKYGYLAGEDKDRASDLMDMFIDDEVDAIICFRGGYGSARMLPYIDLDTIKKHPKVICGFSDITLILNYLYKKLDLITFHGPMIKSNLSDKITREYFFNATMNKSANYQIDLNSFDNIQIYNSRSISGKLVGGNLSIICSSIGTTFEIDTKDKILFIEDVNEKIYAIDRMLTQLSLSNKLNNCKGFIIGQFTPNDNDMKEHNFKLEELLYEKIVSLGKPTIMNLPFGHEYPNITLPVGGSVKIDLNENLIYPSKPFVK
ncbi:LD-carboxypeptidase [Clostridium manihotivorum]|uniref:LD-carboxypeptidase n=1 Tax=Clostridium manihotivorum TaxID=2320868 RepID=A0A410E1H6_9CLOT|nr:LD-carboxypeptidase [Clostridium manihotivorum]QAA35210.1 LD-carboxypeptidase [Clostridium manihotivorum]